MNGLPFTSWPLSPELSPEAQWYLQMLAIRAAGTGRPAPAEHGWLAVYGARRCLACGTAYYSRCKGCGAAR
jgi:hypothetical protein